MRSAVRLRPARRRRAVPHGLLDRAPRDGSAPRAGADGAAGGFARRTRSASSSGAGTTATSARSATSWPATSSSSSRWATRPATRSADAPFGREQMLLCLHASLRGRWLGAAGHQHRPDPGSHASRAPRQPGRQEPEMAQGDRHQRGPHHQDSRTSRSTASRGMPASSWCAATRPPSRSSGRSARTRPAGTSTSGTTRRCGGRREPCGRSRSRPCPRATRPGERSSPSTTRPPGRPGASSPGQPALAGRPRSLPASGPTGPDLAARPVSRIMRGRWIRPVTDDLGVRKRRPSWA